MEPHVLPSSFDSRVAALLAQSAAALTASARLLRDNGYDEDAERAERSAAAARDGIEQRDAVARMFGLAKQVRQARDTDSILGLALDGAIGFLGADFGNIQLLDPRDKTLRITCQRGFDENFLDRYAVVDGQELACGRAARARAQAVIADVNADHDFAPHRRSAAAAGFRAVQSTPLIDRSGHLSGVLSTHFRRPHRPQAHELRITETYARLVADALNRQHA